MKKKFTPEEAILRHNESCRRYYYENREFLMLTQVYYNMMARCYNENHKHYHNYGGRGIAICERWLGENGRNNFLIDMGIRPDGYVLDRLNNDLGYSPANCAWVTVKENQRNRRMSVYMRHNGNKLHYVEVAEMHGLLPATLLNRMKKGWPKDRLFTPARTYKNHKYTN